MENLPIKISIIIEWKNQETAADERAVAMLTALRDQWQQLDAGMLQQKFDPCCEILFVHGDEAAKEGILELTKSLFDETNSAFVLRLIESADLTYYQMKHYGAEVAAGDILIFLDSDVVPDSGWLAALLDAASQNGVQVVCGNTYIAPDGLLGKAFALGWFFPLRSERSGIEANATCYSNNIAFATEVYRAYPFQEITGTTRAAMSRLSRTLAARGIPVRKCHDAQVSHPPPQCCMHFIRRALAHGRDIYFKTNHFSSDTKKSLRGALVDAKNRYNSGVGKIFSQYQRVGLAPAQIPVVLALVTLYYGLFACGSVLTHMAPEYMAGHFKI